MKETISKWQYNARNMNVRKIFLIFNLFSNTKRNILFLLHFVLFILIMLHSQYNRIIIIIFNSKAGDITYIKMKKKIYPVKTNFIQDIEKTVLNFMQNNLWFFKILSHWSIKQTLLKLDILISNISSSRFAGKVFFSKCY